MTDASIVVLDGGGGGRRPAPVRQASLPTFDPSDGDGTVHTTLPPSQIIPPHFADPWFMRADFNGVTLPGETDPPMRKPDGSWNYPAIVAAGGVTITSGRWTGLRIPYISGANTTPPTMLMTPMAIRYPRDVQDAILTEHAERGYDDFVISPQPWEDPRAYSPAEIIAWVQYVKSWGFRAVIWCGGHPPDNGPDTMLETLFEGNGVDWYIHGKEVDIQGYARAEDYDASLHAMDAYVGGRVPILAHFTANGAREMSYPIGADREYFLTDWSPFDGRVGLALQSCGQTPDGSGLTLAGRQGASTAYARQRVHLGVSEHARGREALKSRIVLFETMPTAQLYGQCSEEYGCLRNLEMLGCPPTDARFPPFGGFGSGGRWHDGNVL